MTNGRGQLRTIRQNIFAKYGRYQVHPRPSKKDNQQPDDPRIAVLKQVAPELFADTQDRKNKALSEVLQDIHDRNNR